MLGKHFFPRLLLLHYFQQTPKLIWDRAAYFYANDGIVASTQLDSLQREFDVRAGLFDRFGLRMNTRNMVSMACQQCNMPGGMLVVEY